MRLMLSIEANASGMTGNPDRSSLPWATRGVHRTCVMLRSLTQ
jgi:hypothetical protein